MGKPTMKLFSSGLLGQAVGAAGVGAALLFVGFGRPGPVGRTICRF